MTVTGDKKLIKNLEKTLLTMPDALGAALMKEGYSVQEEGMPLTPVEADILRRSWYVAPPKSVGKIKSPVVEVGVGTSYALFVHEDTKANHPRGGQAKFIKAVVDRRRSGYVQRIAKWTFDFFKRGFGIRQMPRLAPSEPSAESKSV
jgi:hypothetical protein